MTVRLLIVVPVAALALLACADPTTTPPPGGAGIASVTLNTDMLEAVALGDTLTFTATVRDSTGEPRTDVVVSWTSAAPGIAASLGGGRFRAVALGDAIIHASAGTVDDSAVVRVHQVMTGLAVTAPADHVFRGDTLRLTASATDARGNVMSVSVTWSSSDTAVASINGDGVVSGRKLGATTGQATSGALAASVDLRTVTEYTAVEASLESSCAVDRTGAILCWGEIGPYWGIRQAPVLVQETAFTTVVSGSAFGCGLNAAQRARCWGSNWRWSLGNTTIGAMDDTRNPVAVEGDDAFLNLTAGHHHACGVRVDGVAICWGENVRGQLGRGTFDTAGAPGPVAGGHDWRRVSGRSYDGVCGVTRTDSLFCWGHNLNGAVGDPAIDSTATPTPIRPDLQFQDVDRNGMTCGLTTAGVVYCWGGVTGGTTPASLTLPQAATALTVGAAHGCAILADSVAYCWGHGGGGALGNGSYEWGPFMTPVAVQGGLRFVALSAGLGRTCGIATDRSLYCWGTPNGDGTGPNSSTVPVRVAWQP